MATPLPNQQVVGESALPSPGDQASSSTTSASASSGSIGPFFAVISVLTVLTILSCYFGRIYGRRAAVAPLERIEIGGGFFGWVRTKCRWCTACHDVEVGLGGNNNKVVLGEDKSDTKVRDGEV